uniref:Uncharacterized protein n=1 Tax=Branchiostoma floridae TaxID=7739 RepID=C3Y6K9_BRAFL|eukprot:XP_002607959.1 hypothetical protein BRAFLDRAFT_74908 [Branchiostoma floridae]
MLSARTLCKRLGYRLARRSLSTAQPELKTEYDAIIVGGGHNGLVARHGLKVYLRDPNSFTPLLEPDGTGQFRSLLLGKDLKENQRQIAQFSQRDAEIFPEYEHTLGRIGEAIEPLLDNAPLDLQRLSHGTRLEKMRALMTAKPLAEAGMCDKKYVLLHHVMGELEGVKGAWGYVEGGMGAVSEAISRSAQEQGATVLTERPVSSIQVNSSGEACGVVLEDGTEIKSTMQMVMSNATPKVTYLDLLSKDLLPEDFLSEVSHVDYKSPVTKINVAVDQLPNFKAAPNTADNAPLPHHRCTIHLNCEDSALIDEAYHDAVAHGIPSKKPVIEMCIPSSLDPTIAPPGCHVVTLFTQYTPYHRKDGREWDDETRNEYADRGKVTVHTPYYRKYREWDDRTRNEYADRGKVTVHTPYYRKYREWDDQTRNEYADRGKVTVHTPYYRKYREWDDQTRNEYADRGKVTVHTPYYRKYREWDDQTRNECADRGKVTVHTPYYRKYREWDDETRNEYADRGKVTVHTPSYRKYREWDDQTRNEYADRGKVTVHTPYYRKYREWDDETRNKKYREWDNETRNEYADRGKVTVHTPYYRKYREWDDQTRNEYADRGKVTVHTPYYRKYREWDDETRNEYADRGKVTVHTLYYRKYREWDDETRNEYADRGKVTVHTPYYRKYREWDDQTRNEYADRGKVTVHTPYNRKYREWDDETRNEKYRAGDDQTRNEYADRGKVTVHTPYYRKYREWGDQTRNEYADRGKVTVHTPYYRKYREWSDQTRNEYADRVFDNIEEYAPGFKSSVVGRDILTPPDLEKTFGLTGGNIFHGAMSLDQLYQSRPVPSFGNHRCPIKGLYLCGSGAHPGGGVMGAAGKNAATVALADLRR